ncbi:MAG: rhodanese-like domain-containing protein, partial [Planctomycetota bacterium]
MVRLVDNDMKVCFGAHSGCAIYKLFVLCLFRHARVFRHSRVQEIGTQDGVTPLSSRVDQQTPPRNVRSNESVLVDPQWLAARINTEGSNNSGDAIRIIGMGQGIEQYLAAHIPGEVFVDWKTEIHDSHNPEMFNLPSRDQIESLLSRLGITPDTTIVLSDNMSSRLSARMFWTLRCYGHEKIKILDGGRRAWIQSGRSFTTEVPDIKPSRYIVTHENHRIRAELADVKTRLESGHRNFLIDSRPVEHFTGEEAGAVYHTGEQHERKGHIPTAHHIAWTDNFSEFGRFKPVEQLRDMYEHAGFDKNA